MKRVTHTDKMAQPLHVEAPGCIVNIHAGLDANGKRCTRVDVIADQGTDKPDWRCPDFGGSRSVTARVVEGAERVKRVELPPEAVTETGYLKARREVKAGAGNHSSRWAFLQVGVTLEELNRLREFAPGCEIIAKLAERVERAVNAPKAATQESARCGVPVKAGKTCHLFADHGGLIHVAADGSVFDAAKDVKSCIGTHGLPVGRYCQLVRGHDGACSQWSDASVEAPKPEARRA